eukprot:scaffold228_cov312-Pinguiococcus_pyrenoidosus.AAC.67
MSTAVHAGQEPDNTPHPTLSGAKACNSFIRARVRARERGPGLRAQAVHRSRQSSAYSCFKISSIPSRISWMERVRVAPFLRKRACWRPSHTVAVSPSSMKAVTRTKMGYSFTRSAEICTCSSNSIDDAQRPHSTSLAASPSKKHLYAGSLSSALDGGLGGAKLL